MNKSESKYFNTAVKMDTALMSLLNKKPFKYITVRELCETAGVNRSTFYLHYENMGDLLEEAARHLIDGFLSYFDVDSDAFVRNISNYKEPDLNFICDKYLTPYLTYIRDNKEVILTALDNKKSFSFEKIYSRMFENIFDPILDRFHYPMEDRKYVMMYYLNGITAVITEWIKGGCEKCIKDISGIIQTCVFGLNNYLKQ